MVASSAGIAMTSICSMLWTFGCKEGSGSGVVSRPVATPSLVREFSEADTNGGKYKLPGDGVELTAEELLAHCRLYEI